ncbi:MAG: AbrB/MazE/SpoVT family DNA-binding domain-containing protein [Thermodesulfobacteriota bacterium]
MFSPSPGWSANQGFFYLDTPPASTYPKARNFIKRKELGGEEMATATITSKGQITIPKDIRKALNTETGDRVEFLIDASGTVTLVPATADVRKLKGMIPRGRKTVSLDAMQEAIEEEGSSR